MPTMETPKPPRAAAKTDPVKAVSPAIKEGISDAAREVVRGAIFDKRPYLKMAFANPYNLSLFFGTLAAAGLTLNPVLAMVALGLEALWLLHAPDSGRLKHILWDPKFDKLRKALEAQERAERLKNLGEGERMRVETLVARREEIGQLAAQNPSFTGELLRGELVKTDKLVGAFVDVSLTCARYEAYLKTIDDRALQKDVDRYAAAVRAGAPDDPRTRLSQKNLAIVLKRQERMQEIKRYLGVARGQLDLIENSFQLIADQIVTMQSPQELSGQLDELLNGVEAIRETARDTEALIGSIERNA